MSSIPPAGHAGLIQTQGAQDRAESAKQKENANQAASTSKDTFSRELQEIIEASDKDTEIYSDAEGAGSQGKRRSEDENPQDDDANDNESPTPEGPGGLDISA